jgi:hypothetical protein
MTGEASWARDIARRVLEHKSRGNRDPEGLVEAAEDAYQKLYTVLARLIGPRAPHVVLARALRRPAAEFPFLAGIPLAVEEGTYLRELQGKVRGLDHAQVMAGLVAVLAEYLTTLVSLIGRELCDGLVHQAWPEIETEE